MRIVVGVDGSPASRRALARALEEAHEPEDHVHVVLVYEPIVPTPRAYGLEPVTPARSRAIAEAALAGIITEELDRVEGRVTTDVVCGEPGPSLTAAARGADLLVVGSDRPHGVFRAALGHAVSDYCSRHAPCSVLIVRPDAPVTTG
jgi:nucleotide-binding universal stress UspA family protein